MITTTAPRLEQVAALFRAARDLVQDDCRNLLRLPALTPTGLEALSLVLRTRPDLNAGVGMIVQRAAGIPSASRRRRVLLALARWLLGVPREMRRAERWFSGKLVKDVAGASVGAATEPEVAGLLALYALNGLADCFTTSVS